MTCKEARGPIYGAWSVIRTCPYDGTESILGLYPEGKAALLKLEWFMEDPSDNEEFKLEFHKFESVEQLTEKQQTMKANRAEWDEKSRIYENYKKDKEEQEQLNKEYNEEHNYVASDT